MKPRRGFVHHAVGRALVIYDICRRMKPRRGLVHGPRNPDVYPRQDRRRMKPRRGPYVGEHIGTVMSTDEAPSRALFTAIERFRQWASTDEAPSRALSTTRLRVAAGGVDG